MEKVFYISTDGMKVYEWRNNKLVDTVMFRKSCEDVQLLQQYLSFGVKRPVRLIVDLIEEEFKTERIPQLRGSERRNVINRLLDRHYRDIDYITVRSNGILKAARKEEELLICSLVNSDNVHYWLNILEDHEVPISGIFSAPLLQIDAVRQYTKANSNMLLVSSDTAWCQRETFFKAGQVKFSRLEKLEHNLHRSDNAELIVQNLVRGTEQIRHYLTNQRVLGFTDQLTVICVVAEAAKEECNRLLAQHQSDLINYSTIDDSSLINSAKAPVRIGQGNDTLLAWCASKKPALANDYATQTNKKRYFSYVIDSGIRHGAALVCVGLLAFAAILAIDAYTITQKTERIWQEQTRLINEYDDVYAPKEESIAIAPRIKDSIELIEHYNIAAEVRPQAYFPVIADVYSEPLFKHIRLDKIAWSKHAASSIPELVSMAYGVTNSSDSVVDDDEYTDDTFTDIANDTEIPVLRLSGVFKNQEQAYGTTVSLMEQFIEALSNINEVKELHLISTPVEIRPDYTFSDKVGTQVVKTTAINNYEFLLVLKPEVKWNI